MWREARSCSGEEVHQLTWLGVAFVLIGVALIALPLLGRHIDFSKIPPWLVYVHRGDGFYFVTSPFLLLLSILSLAIYLLKK
jgi:hypothetical protein